MIDHFSQRAQTSAVGLSFLGSLSPSSWQAADPRPGSALPLLGQFSGDWPWSSWRFYFLQDASILAMDRLG